MIIYRVKYNNNIEEYFKTSLLARDFLRKQEYGDIVKVRLDMPSSPIDCVILGLTNQVYNKIEEVKVMYTMYKIPGYLQVVSRQ